jgi:two-component system response regulator GlrR
MNKHKLPILLVDDDLDLLRLLSIRLQAAGYRVEEAQNARQALSKLPLVKPRLVITDLRMDGMDGLALFRQIHETYPTLPVVILTAHGTIPDAIDATQQGVFGYLTKPFDSRELLDTVGRATQLSAASLADSGRDSGWRANIVTRSPLMEELLQRTELAAASEASILIQSESGTGKELLARAIHNASKRREGPFVAVNCSAIPDQLFESELFGHARGAFTGAAREHAGLCQAAHGGTLFLDEIGDMPLPFQAKMLRVLQEKEVRPVGSTQPLPVDVRIVSATHADLEAAVSQCRFREDLYYRLNVVMLELPTLARRREDIPLLADHFLRMLQKDRARKVQGFSVEAMEQLVAAPWPGNVRQLLNVVEQSLVFSASPIISEQLVQSALRSGAERILSFSEARDRFERDYLMRLLQITSGNVTQAARLARRNRTEFYKLLNRHHLEPEQFRAGD